MCYLAYTQLMVIKSKKGTAIDEGHRNYYALVGGHRTGTVGSQHSSGLIDEKV